MSRIDKRRNELELRVDWAPAYELLLSVSAYLASRKLSNLELGQVWLRHVRQVVPADFSAPELTKHTDDDLLLVLALVCPGARDADAFVDWLAQLTPGGMYEAVRAHLRTEARLPREFDTWRDRVVASLRTWNERYFSAIDPAILSGLREHAAALEARLGSRPPIELVEETTNGLWWEPAPELRRLVLVPQYHLRPYNEETNLHDGVVVLYPADILPTPEDAPPTGLLRLTRGLGDESRLRILRFLTHGPRTLTEVARFAGLSQPTVHHHLTQLRVAGLVLVHCSLSGTNRYSLRPQCVEDLAHQLGSYLEPTKGGAR